MKKIVFTGGHHNSALSVARELQSSQDLETVWYGHKHTMAGDSSVSAEYREVTESGIQFRELHAGKVYKTWNLIQLLKVPYGFLQAYYYLLRDRPHLIVSFGGYLAAPVVVAGWMMGIPIVTHEQTTVVGLSNKVISKFADKIFITWPQSKKYFPSQKVTITGLPLRPAIFEVKQEDAYFEKILPTIYITGGKQGSHILNQTIAESLPSLLKHTNIIHQCGSNSVHNDLSMLQEHKEQLPEKLRERYIVKDYFFENEIGAVFNCADLVISRAGAHTVYEIAALGKPALFVPIPWASHNEQYKNARILVNEGLATILPEDRLTAQRLEEEVKRMLKHLDEFTENAERAKSRIIFDATDRIINEIQTLLQTSNAEEE